LRVPDKNTGSGPTLTIERVAAALHEAQQYSLHVVLLVDTLDLLLNDPASRAVVNDVVNLAHRLKVRTVVTTRPMEAAYLRIVYVSAEAVDALAETVDSRALRGITLGPYEGPELEQAIQVHAHIFYRPVMADEAARVMTRASIRGYPLAEVTRNPLRLRILFELYASREKIPDSDVDSIMLNERYVEDRIASDTRAGPDAGPQTDMTRAAEAIAYGLLAEGSVQDDRIRLAELITGDVGRRNAPHAVDTLQRRDVLRALVNAIQLRFPHQVIFEHVSACSIARRGASAVEVPCAACAHRPHRLVPRRGNGAGSAPGGAQLTDA
jgi:hypothetical protein